MSQQKVSTTRATAEGIEEVLEMCNKNKKQKIGK